MRYFDTSFLAPLILPEAASDPVADFMETLSREDLAVSHWTRVEFSSLLAREVRMGRLGEDSARAADTRFETMVDRSFAILLPDRADFDLAKAYLGRFETGLRAGDALHLAIAANRRAETLYSLDRKLIEAGRHLGVPASAGISLSTASP
ncbi:MAG: type II toxin-antitoxin system VapC family toxin [Rhodospirillaceae bacterium]|nr:type II toxin-antitoxin system VapC family toxin [Rhodospirillaceae bacterium]MYJ71223.1 type II toxin-antitoxin system VapC family toxin [Rhodospirillaceae bacterium]